MNLETPVASLLTVAGIAPIASMLSQLIWRTAGHNASGDAIQDRFGPVVAFVVAIILAEVALWATSVAGLNRLDVLQAALTGGLGGLAAIGIHDVVTTKAGLA